MLPYRGLAMSADTIPRLYLYFIGLSIARDCDDTLPKTIQHRTNSRIKFKVGGHRTGRPHRSCKDEINEWTDCHGRRYCALRTTEADGQKSQPGRPSGEFGGLNSGLIGLAYDG